VPRNRVVRNDKVEKKQRDVCSAFLALLNEGCENKTRLVRFDLKVAAYCGPLKAGTVGWLETEPCTIPVSMGL